MRHSVLAVDGNNLIHRAHHALAGSNLTSPTGEPLWALHGLAGLIAKHALARTPRWLLIAFDAPDATVPRRALDPGYKQGRPETDPHLKAQIAAAPTLLAQAGLAVLQVPGYEADDILASVATTAATAGIPCELLTADRDALRCVSPDCLVISPDGPILDPDAVIKKYGVPPHRYGEFAALVGEPGDNLPGVTGIGPKNAARIINATTHLEEVLSDTDRAYQIVGQRLTPVLLASAARVRLTLQVATLAQNIPVRPALKLSELPADSEKITTTFQQAHLPQAGARLAAALSR